MTDYSYDDALDAAAEKLTAEDVAAAKRYADACAVLASMSDTLSALAEFAPPDPETIRELDRRITIELLTADQEANKEAVYRSTPEPWEIAPGWEVEVAAPCRRHLLAPRDARAILEVAGQLADRGVSPAIIVRLLDDYLLYRL